ncbi:MAG: acyl-CoA synthetase [Candidatus Binatia bacterium]|nr:MAG: acyl-CoA synthetase [Candidatus Binatia bacterium]
MTLGELIRRKGTDPATRDRPCVRFFGYECSFGEFYRECIAWARLFLAVQERGVNREVPFHVGILLDNTPDFLFALGGSWLAGAVAVGINNTKRGQYLARDIRHTDCQVLVTEPQYLELVSSVLDEAGLAANRVIVSKRWQGRGRAPAGSLVKDLPGSCDAEVILHEFRGEPDPYISVDPTHLAMLIFTSGTVTAPKAVCCSHKRLVETGENIARNVYGLGPEDAGYIAMPLFHANAIMCGLLPALTAGVPVGLARKFSKQHWLEDIRRYRATYFNYTGKPLAYILSTPRQPDDADNPLRICFGNEGSYRVVREFEERFGCRVVDVFGSSEGGLGVTRQPDDPPGSIGFPAPGITVVDERGRERPPARFDDRGRLLNPEECIGEIVNTQGVAWFEGYYKNEPATAERTRFGWYWSGDLGYRDERGFLYFVGRTTDWLRVDGENFLARPIEEILLRHPDVALCAVYGVPDPDGGDQVMAALVLRSGASFDAREFAAFLRAQPDLSPKWIPKFVRIAGELPQTASTKVLKTELRRQKFFPERCAGDALFWRPGREVAYRQFSEEDLRALLQEFTRVGRSQLLDV